jgi:lysophospholipase L1-like esterase
MIRHRPVSAAASALALLAGAAWSAGALLRRQAAIARRRIGKPLGESALDADRVWRRSLPGEPLELLVVGDSIAAGLGAHRPKDTLGARVAKGLGDALGRPVRLRTVAVVGAESSEIAAQLDRLPPAYAPQIALVVVGGNDVTHRVPVATSVIHLSAAVGRLRDRGAAVVVATCPDLGALRAVPQPLRRIAARASRRLAAAQAEAAAAAGARVVSLRETVGPMFLSEPDEMFSLDRFHPSALGYRRTAAALVPVALASVATADARPGGA